jgi:hypothetical protein
MHLLYLFQDLKIIRKTMKKMNFKESQNQSQSQSQSQNQSQNIKLKITKTV